MPEHPNGGPEVSLAIAEHVACPVRLRRRVHVPGLQRALSPLLWLLSGMRSKKKGE